MEVVHIISEKRSKENSLHLNVKVTNLAQEQRKEIDRVSVWNLVSNIKEHEKSQDEKLIFFQTSRSRFLMNKQLNEYIVKSSQGTVFHLHGGFVPEYLAIAFLLKKLNFIYIYTPHGSFNAKGIKKHTFLKMIYFYFVERQIIKRTKAVHCLGELEVEAVLKLAPQADCVLIPNGKSLEGLGYYHENINRKKNLIFGYHGEIDVHDKGLDLLLQSFAKYRLKFNGIGELWLMGGGKELRALKQMALDLGVQNDVVFYGEKSGEEMLNILGNMDVFFRPSRSENFPDEVIQAAGMEKPCVVSKETNIGEYIEQYDAGIVLKKNKVNFLASAMKEMQKRYLEGELKFNADNSNKMMMREFSWEVIAHKLKEVY